MARGQISSHSFPQDGPQADSHFLSGLLTFHIVVVVLSYRSAGSAKLCRGNFFVGSKRGCRSMAGGRGIIGSGGSSDAGEGGDEQSCESN